MIVSINQPAYLPWLGYFDRIRRSDLHIVLDHVQFEKGSYTNRCRIKQRDGREMWLTVPVEKGKPINETRIVGDAWRKKHATALYQAYSVRSGLYSIERWPSILSLCRTSAYSLAEGLRVHCESGCSSDLGGTKLGVKSDLVLNLCKDVGATQYLSGPQGRNYLDLPSFEKAGIEVLYHDFPTDGDWGLSAVHHLSRSFEWPQVDLISAHCSQGSEQEVAPLPT